MKTAPVQGSLALQEDATHEGRVCSKTGKNEAGRTDGGTADVEALEEKMAEVQQKVGD